jgi:hypothetical protein
MCKFAVLAAEKLNRFDSPASRFPKDCESINFIRLLNPKVTHDAQSLCAAEVAIVAKIVSKGKYRAPNTPSPKQRAGSQYETVNYFRTLARRLREVSSASPDNDQV